MMIKKKEIFEEEPPRHSKISTNILKVISVILAYSSFILPIKNKLFWSYSCFSKPKKKVNASQFTVLSHHDINTRRENYTPISLNDSRGKDNQQQSLNLSKYTPTRYENIIFYDQVGYVLRI